MVSTRGLNKAEVIAALYNHARPQGLGFIQYEPGDMTIPEAEEIVLRGRPFYFDYLKGRVMKVNLDSDNEFDERLYDRDNGEGAAQRAIDSIRVIKPIGRKMPQKLYANFRDKTGVATREHIICCLAYKIAEGIVENHLFTLKSAFNPDGAEYTMTVELLPPVDGGDAQR